MKKRKRSGLQNTISRKWSPKLRAGTFSDRRTKRLKTRERITREAITNG